MVFETGGSILKIGKRGRNGPVFRFGALNARLNTGRLSWCAGGVPREKRDGFGGSGGGGVEYGISIFKPYSRLVFNVFSCGVRVLEDLNTKIFILGGSICVRGRVARARTPAHVKTRSARIHIQNRLWGV